MMNLNGQRRDNPRERRSTTGIVLECELVEGESRDLRKSLHTNANVDKVIGEY